MRIGSGLSIIVWAIVLGGVGYFAWEMNARQREERALREALARLTSERRLARILVDDIATDTETGTTVIHLRWADEPPPGQALDPSEIRSIKVFGKEAWFDTWQIIFGKDSVSEGDPLRGKTLTLLRRVYGSDQKPGEGTALHVPPSLVSEASGEDDAPDLVPRAYRKGSEAPSELETRLWKNFWRMCRSAEFAKEQGVRTVQGTAVHKPMVAGREYHLTVDNEGQIFLDGPFTPDPFIQK